MGNDPWANQKTENIRHSLHEDSLGPQYRKG